MIINREEFSERIAKARKMMEKKILGALIVSPTADVRYLSNYTPLAGGAMVLIPAEDEPVLLIDQEWDLARAKEISSIPDTRATADFVKDVPKILESANTKGRIGIVGWSTFPTPVYLSIRKALPEVDLEDATEITRDLRMIKSPAEIKCLEKAAKVTSEGHKAATEAIAEGKTEVEIATAADIAMKLAGADSELSFHPVVGSGHRSLLDVASPTEKKIKNGELVLMDLGGRYKGYCGDMTRAKVCGTPKKEQKDLWEVVSQMHREAIQSVGPGIKVFEVYEVVKRIARETGYEARFNPGAILGHGTGLVVHEEPIIGTEDTELVPGIVHTIEPGLFVPGVGGIRIEDMVLVTDTGRRILTEFDRGL